MSDVLVLNFTYQALNLTTIQRAVRLLLAGKAEVVHARSDVLRAPSLDIRLPSVIRMLYYIKRGQQNVPLTKRNVLLRDDHRCQYCGVKGIARELTVDHVHPKSRGGRSTWENLATACVRCNGRKSNRTPDEARMTLLRRPKQPRFIPWLRVKRNVLPDEWGAFLFWNVSIEERVEA